MKVFDGIEDFVEKIGEHSDQTAAFSNRSHILTIGTFDGVHIGHRYILERVHQIAQKKNTQSVLLTFFPHPRMVLFPDDSSLKLLNTMPEKIELIAQTGIDYLVVQPFTKDFSRTSVVEYIRDLLINKLGARTIVIGYDHHFGKNREGNLNDLLEFCDMYDYSVEEIPAQDIQEVNVSSTKIRKALEEGDVQLANSYLGYEYMINGKVVHGEKIGRKLGYPTANIEIEESFKLIPADGIYAVRVYLKKSDAFYQGMMSIGVRPTIHSENKKTIEVNIFEFNQEIYEEEIRVHFVQRLRDEKKFENVNELIDAMKMDKIRALNVFG